MSCTVSFIFFFFSSRRRHTRSLCDWSSDVCSSDLTRGRRAVRFSPTEPGAGVVQRTIVERPVRAEGHQPTRTPAVEVVGLRKEFLRRDQRAGRFARRRRVAALDDVTFTIGRGETVAILGQNGSGKSTLVRLLSTLLLPDGGTARIFGHDIATDPGGVRRLVNRVSVEASFFKKMSAAENLGYAARFYGMGHGETREKIPEILARVGFPPDRRGEPMEALSRGMQQKVALARALLTSPVLLLLD